MLKNARKSDLVHAMSMITRARPDGAGYRPRAWQLHHHLSELAPEFPDQYSDRHHRPRSGSCASCRTSGRKVAPLDFIGFLQSAAGLTFLLAGLEFVVQGTTGLAASVGLIAAGAVSSIIATGRFARVDAPLLDLSAFKIQTFAMSTLSAGTASRVAINATPFLIPLLFQVGFGRTAINAGTYLLFYFAGNLGMKAVTTQMLKAFGFRNVLVFNGLISSASIGACAFLSRRRRTP